MSAWSNSYEDRNYRLAVQPTFGYRVGCITGIALLLLFTGFVAYNDSTVCQQQLTACMIHGIETVRKHPLPGERIKTEYVDRSYVIYPITEPSVEYMIDCWGYYCGDKVSVFVGRDIACYYDGSTMPRESCKIPYMDDL